jgi:hypothetical protein
MGPRSIFRGPKRTGRSYFADKQGLPGKQIGVGSPLSPFDSPNAVPNTTNKNPIMIFAFMCLSSAAVAAWHGF